MVERSSRDAEKGAPEPSLTSLVDQDVLQASVGVRAGERGVSGTRATPPPPNVDRAFGCHRCVCPPAGLHSIISQPAPTMRPPDVVS
jgi:hypothetical protein